MSNKHGAKLIDFEKKTHPPRISTLHVYGFNRFFFHPPLFVYCRYALVFSKKVHPPPFIDSATFAFPLSLFLPPLLLWR
jgi:hypothetical protein